MKSEEELLVKLIPVYFAFIVKLLTLIQEAVVSNLSFPFGFSSEDLCLVEQRLVLRLIN